MSSSIRLGCLRSLRCQAQNGCHLHTQTHTHTHTHEHTFTQCMLHNLHNSKDVSLCPPSPSCSYICKCMCEFGLPTLMTSRRHHVLVFLATILAAFSSTEGRSQANGRQRIQVSNRYTLSHCACSALGQAGISPTSMLSVFFYK